MGIVNWFSSFFSRGNFGRWGFRMFGGPQFNDYSADKAKLAVIFSSPALLKVVSLQCDLFSLGRISVCDIATKKEVENDPVLNLLDQPNPFQSKSQFLWDVMFWNMIGNCYIYLDSNIAENPDNKMYCLDSSKMEFPPRFRNEMDKIILSKKKVKEIMDTTIIYRYNDGSTFDILLSKVITIMDLTNGVGNWLKSPSRIDALYKIISNSEASLDSQNINIRFAGKVMIAGTTDQNDVSRLMLDSDEKNDIENKANSSRQVTAVKSMIEIKRFLEDGGILGSLEGADQHAYYRIGAMYGIPKDVLEAYNESSTFENQEKAIGRHVAYCMQPKGDDLTTRLARRFGYYGTKKIEISWDYLPFMQVFEADRAKSEKIEAETFKTTAEAFKILLDQGVSLQEANDFLETNFTTGEKNLNPTPISSNSNGK